MKRWAEYFAARGHEIHVLSFRAVELNGVKIYPLRQLTGNLSKISVFAAAVAVRRLVRSIKPDVLHSHYVTSYGLLGALSGWRPFVVSAWGSDILLSENSPIRRIVARYVLGAADVVMSDSRYMANVMLTMTRKINLSQVEIFPFGVPRRFFEKVNVCNVINAADEPLIRIASLRALEPNYNIDTIIKAIGLVVRTLPSTRLYVGNNGTERVALLALVKRLGLNNLVYFKGTLSHEEVIDELSEAMIFISVPESDSTSVTLLEAMMVGTFPILSDIPANREWVNDGRNGLLVRPKDERHLASQITAAIRDLELRRRAAQINRNLILREAIWEDNMERMDELYKTLVQHHFADPTASAGAK